MKISLHHMQLYAYLCNYIYTKRDLYLNTCSTLIIYAGHFKDKKAPLCSRDIQGTGENMAFVKLLRVWAQFQHMLSSPACP